MKRNTVGKIILLTFMVGIFALPVNAAQVEGISYSDNYAAENINLRLTGAGLLRYWGFKAYTGALYLEEGVLFDAVLSDTAKRIELEYFRASLSPQPRPSFGPRSRYRAVPLRGKGP